MNTLDIIFSVVIVLSLLVIIRTITNSKEYDEFILISKIKLYLINNDWMPWINNDNNKMIYFKSNYSIEINLFNSGENYIVVSTWKLDKSNKHYINKFKEFRNIIKELEK